MKTAFEILAALAVIYTSYVVGRDEGEANADAKATEDAILPVAIEAGTYGFRNGVTTAFEIVGALHTSVDAVAEIAVQADVRDDEAKDVLRALGEYLDEQNIAFGERVDVMEIVEPSNVIRVQFGDAS